MSSFCWYYFLDGVFFLGGVTNARSLFTGVLLIKFWLSLDICNATSNLRLTFLYRICNFCGGVFYFSKKFFAVSIFSRILQLVCRNSNVKQIINNFIFNMTPVSRTYMAFIPIHSISSKIFLYFDCMLSSRGKR